MARPTDNSLKYYNQDTKDDDNLQYVEAVHGLTGYAIVHKLWKHIYGCPDGYYCDWDDINKMIFCKNNGIDLAVLDAIVETCFLDKIEIFDKKMAMEQQILTSKGIQKRWSKIVKEAGRKSNKVKELHRLISLDTDTPPDNHQETTPPPQLNGTETPQSKVNKIKEKESKVNETIAPKAPVDISSASVLDFIKSKFTGDFLPVWQRWKDYKLKEFKFKYKSEDSEMEAFNELLKVSDGIEAAAVEIVKKSIGQGWKGFFAIAEPVTKAAIAGKIAAVKINDVGKNGVNYLYERYCENPTQVTVLSIEASDYDVLKRAGFINFTEAKTKDIHDSTMDYLALNNKDQNETNVKNFMKKFGVIEYFRACNAENKPLIFST